MNEPSIEDVIESSESIKCLLSALGEELGQELDLGTILNYLPLSAGTCPYCVMRDRLESSHMDFECIPDCGFAMSHGQMDCDDPYSVWWRLAVTSVKDMPRDGVQINGSRDALIKLCENGFPIYTDVDEFMEAKKELLRKMIAFFPANEEFLKALEEY